MSETFQEAAEAIAEEMVDLLIKKQADYGPKNILEFGLVGVLIRTNDKIERLKNLYGVKDGTFQPKEVNNESVLDTWRDLGNYAIIAQMLINGNFELPIKDKEILKTGTCSHCIDPFCKGHAGGNYPCTCERCNPLNTDKFYPEDEKDATPERKCSHCGWSEFWFDRTVSYNAEGTDCGMHEICGNCGIAADELPPINEENK